MPKPRLTIRRAMILVAVAAGFCLVARRLRMSTRPYCIRIDHYRLEDPPPLDRFVEPYTPSQEKLQ